VAVIALLLFLAVSVSVHWREHPRKASTPEQKSPVVRAPTWDRILEGCGALYYSFSPDGKELAWSGISAAVPLDDRFQLGVLSVRDGRVKCLRTMAHGAAHISWSPEGNDLAVVMCDGPLLILNPTNLKTKAEIPFPGNDRRGATAVQYSPDGKSLAVATWDNKISLLDLRSKTYRTVGSLDHFVKFLEFSADGRLLLAASDVISLGVWDLKGRNAPWLMSPFVNPNPGTRSIAGAFCSGDQIITAGGDGFVRIWDFPTRRLVASHHARLGHIFRAAMPKDRSSIVLGVAGGPVLMSIPSGEVTQRFGPYEASLESVAITPDGKNAIICTDKQDKEEISEGALYRFSVHPRASDRK
jgi:WD40 repeat protein